MQSMILHGSDDLPPNEGEGTIHIRGGNIL